MKKYITVCDKCGKHSIDFKSFKTSPGQILHYIDPWNEDNLYEPNMEVTLEIFKTELTEKDNDYYICEDCFNKMKNEIFIKNIDPEFLINYIKNIWNSKNYDHKNS